MPVNLCAECYLSGYCRRTQSRVVTERELTVSFIRDLRRHANALHIACGQWADFLSESYCTYPGRIVDDAGCEVTLNMDVFELPSIRYWFRDFCKPAPDDIVPRVKLAARQRIIVMASILRAIHPVPASLWGKNIANDEYPQPCQPDHARARQNCPVQLDWGMPSVPLVTIRKN
jgi:hypothetical protein